MHMLVWGILALSAIDLPAIDGEYEGPPGTLTVDNGAGTMLALSGNCSVEGRVVQGKKGYRFVTTRTDGGCSELARLKPGQVCANLTPGRVDGRKGLANSIRFKAVAPGCKPFNALYEIP